MLFRHQLPNGHIISFQLEVRGREVTLSTTAQGVALSRTFLLENDDLDPPALAHRFLHEPLTAFEKLNLNTAMGIRVEP
jgi:hypothetical protein